MNFKKVFLVALLLSAFSLAKGQGIGIRGGVFVRGGYGYGGYATTCGGRPCGYYGGGYGGYGNPYGYNMPYGGFRMSGIKFKMDQIPKNQRRLIETAVVTVDGSEEGTIDMFNSFWNGSLLLDPGPHTVIIELPEAIFRTQVNVRPGTVSFVVPRFRPKTEDEKEEQKERVRRLIPRGEMERPDRQERF